MAQDRHPDTDTSRKTPPPYWSHALRALREARGITQDGWAAQLGYGRATIRRWESGETVPSAEAEAAIIALCREKRLFRTFAEGPLTSVHVSEEWVADLLAAARLGRDGTSVSPPDTPFAPGPVNYALSGDVSIAYQVFGQGPIDLVVTPGAVSHREVDWEHPGAVAFFEQLSRFARVIVFDKRGTGMSDRVAAGTMEERMDDIRAVMDAAGIERAALFGISEGGPMSLLFAATRPERISALILYGTYDRIVIPTPDDPSAQLERLRQVWGTPESPFLERFGPSAASDPSAREWWARYQRMSASPGAVMALNRMNAEIDVSAALPAIHVPVLVLHRAGDRVIDVAEGRALARHIAGARLIELSGEDHLPWLGNVADITGAVERFLTERRPDPEIDHALATVMHAEIDEGDGVETLLAHAHHELARWQGTLVSTEGGVLATFDSPTRAILASTALKVAAQEHGDAARVGIHTGEVALRGDAISGDPIDIAAGLARLAAPGETLVSAIVTELVSSSEVHFALRGCQTVECLSGEVQVFRVEDRPDHP